MSNIEHILLYSFLFIIIPLWGYYNNKKTGIKFWASALMPILLISIIIGCRYWGADYLWYKYQYEHLDSNNVIEEQSSQPIFWGLNLLMNWVGLNYVGAFIVYSIIYFIGVFNLLKNYKESSKYMYLFILFPYILFGTGIIRQTISIGVILFAIPQLNQNKLIAFSLYSLLAINIHSSSLLLIATLLIFKYFTKNPIKPIYSIPIYLTISFIYNPADIEFIGSIIQNFSFINSKFQGYLENSNVWFSDDAYKEAFTQSTPALILQSLFICSVYYLGYITLKYQKEKNILYLYNIVVIGFIFMRMFFNIELMRRIANPMTFFYPITLGYSIFIIKNNPQYFNKRYIIISYSFIIIYLVLYWGRFLLFEPEYIFFWNKQ